MQGMRTGGTGRERGRREMEIKPGGEAISSLFPLRIQFFFLPVATALRHHVDDGSACVCHVRRVLRIHVGGVCASVCVGH